MEKFLKPGARPKIVLMISGWRDLEDKDFVWEKLDNFVERVGAPALLLHGACRGADTLAAEWAREHGIEVKAFPAQWEKEGKKAPLIRNEEMVKQCTHLVAFPNMEFGRGTQHAMNLARKYHKRRFVYPINEKT